MTIAHRCTAFLLGLVLLLSPFVASAAGPTVPPPSAEGPIGRMPPRLSYVDGEVSFWRPGAADWAPAQINTALAPGDETYTGNRGNLELQVGSRAFVRAWGDTQLGLVNQEPDFLQVKVTAGHVSLDLRTVEPGRTVEVDTPMAAFTIDTPGYYRIDVTPERTSFITRRSGRATMTPAGGTPAAIAPSEEVVLDSAPTPAIQTFVAPALDVWDNWNYARTEELIDSMSARYVSSGVYGVDDLDHYGTWRVVPTYGSVWVPSGVPGDWAPYSTGHWVSDPYYGWTWVDDAPWGWAPYHHGRWVNVDGYWAWAPGPLVVRPVYAPALVAFFSAPGVRVTVGVPFVSWVALGWGEPIVPWWGGPRYVGHAHWAGWGGPRVVNNVVVNKTTVVNVQNITVYRNANVHNAVVAVREDAFGRRAVRESRVTEVDVHKMQPVRGALRVKPDASSFVVAHGPAAKPPAQIVEQRVVATRKPVARVVPPEAGREKPAAAMKETAPRIVPAPKPASTVSTPARPPFGASPVERQRESTPPRFEGHQPAAQPNAPRPEAHVEAPKPEPRAQAPRPEARVEAAKPAPAPEVGRQREAPSSARKLPGEPANRVSPFRHEGHSSAPAPSPATSAPQGPVPKAERGDAPRTPPRPAAAHGDRDQRPARDR